VYDPSNKIRDDNFSLRNEGELIKKMYSKLAHAANTEANKIGNFIRIKAYNDEDVDY